MLINLYQCKDDIYIYLGKIDNEIVTYSYHYGLNTISRNKFMYSWIHKVLTTQETLDVLETCIKKYNTEDITISSLEKLIEDIRIKRDDFNPNATSILSEDTRILTLSEIGIIRYSFEPGETYTQKCIDC